MYYNTKVQISATIFTKQYKQHVTTFYCKGNTLIFTQCKYKTSLFVITLYFKVSLLQCNYTFKYWVVLISYMY